MRYQDILIDNYFQMLRSEPTKTYYTTLFYIVNNLLKSSKKPSRKLKDKLTYIFEHTTDTLHLALPKAESLYFDFTQYNKNISHELDITSYNQVLTVTHLQLKNSLDKALLELNNIVTELSKKYNFQFGVDRD